MMSNKELCAGHDNKNNWQALAIAQAAVHASRAVLSSHASIRDKAASMLSRLSNPPF